MFKKRGVPTSLPTGTVGPNGMVPEVVIGAPAIAWRSTVLALQGAVPVVNIPIYSPFLLYYLYSQLLS